MERLECLERWHWDNWRFEANPQPYRQRMLKLARIRDSVRPEPPQP
jgi:hypothetical protein